MKEKRKMNWKMIESKEVNDVYEPQSIAIIDLDFLIRYCIRFTQFQVDLIIEGITEFFSVHLEEKMALYKSFGDEYMIEFYAYHQDEAAEYLSALKKQFRKQHFLEKADEMCRFARISFSAGVADIDEEEDGILMASRKALVALNQAKSLRRNCVVPFNKEYRKNQDIIYYLDKMSLKILFGKSGERGFCKEKTNVREALLDEPQSIDVDSKGNIYIADQNNHSIVTYDGSHVCRVIGNGMFSKGVEEWDVDKNCLNKPTGITVKDNMMYITDTGNDVVWKVNLESKQMSILAGTGVPGYEGDGQQAVKAKLNKPGGVVVDSDNNVYVNDIANNVIRKVDVNGIITTYGGTGEYGYYGEGVDASDATFGEIYGLGIDRENKNIYLADYLNNCIRMIDINTHKIVTIAGTGEEGYSGDGQDAKIAKLSKPVAVTVDQDKNIVIAESGNSCIRIISRKTNKIYTLAGSGTWGIGEEKQGCSFSFANPNGLCVNKDGKLFVLDGSNNRLCEINYERKNEQ